ncbi:unnamed protein product [Brassica oleracea var. botrytis]
MFVGVYELFSSCALFYIAHCHLLRGQKMFSHIRDTC